MYRLLDPPKGGKPLASRLEFDQEQQKLTVFAETAVGALENVEAT